MGAYCENRALSRRGERDHRGEQVTTEHLYPRRLIEIDLPIKRISEHAHGERRSGHISSLHIWWARRPLAACRAVICAALWPDPADLKCPQRFREVATRLVNEFARKAVASKELAAHCSNENWLKWKSLVNSGGLDCAKEAHWNVLRFALFDFIADFADWDNSTVGEYLETSRGLTEAAHEALGGAPHTRPLVVDPFAGGGSIPLEALRVGADTFASDLNPVAVLVNKVLLEYIPKYGQRLADEVRRWGKKIAEEIEKELSEFYPKRSDGAVPIAYLWARTITCEGPGCGFEVPVMKSLWLDTSRGRSVGVQLLDDSKRERRLRVSIISSARRTDIANGTSRRGSVTCPLCGFTTARKRVEAQAKTRGLGERLIAVVFEGPAGRTYESPSEMDYKMLQRAAALIANDGQYSSFIPDEELPYLRSIFNVHVYGFNKWARLFSPRQMLYLSTLARLVSKLDLKSSGLDSSGETALRTVLAFLVDKSAMISCNVARWRGDKGRLEGAFSMQAIPMVWDWAEINPVNDRFVPFAGFVESVAAVIETVSSVIKTPGTVERGSATCVPLPDNSARLVFTDPPYYDSVPYANLSDFFYVWLKRTLGRQYPDYFSDSGAPKDTE